MRYQGWHGALQRALHGVNLDADHRAARPQVLTSLPACWPPRTGADSTEHGLSHLMHEEIVLRGPFRLLRRVVGLDKSEACGRKAQLHIAFCASSAQQTGLHIHMHVETGSVAACGIVQPLIAVPHPVGVYHSPLEALNHRTDPVRLCAASAGITSVL
jgi:hypothetical protein